MARPGGVETRARILDSVRALLAEGGAATLTLDAVAGRVGVTRQAVLYHFGSRDRLLAEVYLETLAAESEALTAIAEEADAGLDGMPAFLRGALDWYLEDPDRFRLIYAVVQTTGMLPAIEPGELEKRVYPVTGRMYSVLEARLAAGDLPEGVDPRKLAVALHMCVLGAACYASLLDAIGETFAHDWHDVLGALARAVASE